MLADSYRAGGALRLIFALGFFLSTGMAMTARASDKGTVFERDVLPIFSERCVKCHGGVKKKGGLSLVSRELMLLGGKSGEAIVVPGKPEESEMLIRVTAKHEDERMPPDEPLEAGQIATLTKWIKLGADWPAHWAFDEVKADPPKELEPDPVAAKWKGRNEIDQYVYLRLASAGIDPSPEADRITLIRRLALDLTGILPTPEEVDAFVDDTREDAYERLVDRLLASPHFGERWGRHWLDQARYADSDGYEKDNARPDAWRWRDWVIDAINKDMPFDQFTIEQMAGDLIPGATPEQILATAFHLQTLRNLEGGVDQEEDRTKRVIDRVNTVGTAWLGLTLSCTQCHDHPYDPISQQEFYQLYSFFNNADETTVHVAKSRSSRDRIDELREKVRTMEGSRHDALRAWIGNEAAVVEKFKGDGTKLHALNKIEATATKGSALSIDESGAVLLKNQQLDQETVVVEGSVDLEEFSGFRLAALPHDSLPARGPGMAKNGNFVLSRFSAYLTSMDEDGGSDLKMENLLFEKAVADFHQNKFKPAGALKEGPKTGWAVSPQMGKPHHIDFFLNNPRKIKRGARVRFQLDSTYGGQHILGHFRVSVLTGRHAAKSKLPAKVFASLSVKGEGAMDAPEVREYYFKNIDPETKALYAEVSKLESGGTVKARVLAEKGSKRRSNYVFHRGDFLQPKKDRGEVTSTTPAIFPTMHSRKPEKGGDRLDLAKWMVDPEHPLTARVAVNTMWMHLFGRGLTGTPEDFGTRGALPSHPFLLDWLAREFVSKGWSRKHMIKTIVSSASYRQSSRHRPELAEQDPTNQWFHRQNRVRVEAEVVRDLHLKASGLLSSKVGGPSVFPPLPPDVAALSYASSFKWSESKGEDRFRRGMYTFFKRTAPDPNLTTFDCPDSNVTLTKRGSSNTPLQALQTLQNIVYVEASQALSRRLLTNEALRDDGARIDQLYRLTVGRKPDARERKIIAGLLAKARDYYREHAKDASDLVGKYTVKSIDPAETAAWVATSRVPLNLDEFITRE